MLSFCFCAKGSKSGPKGWFESLVPPLFFFGRNDFHHGDLSVVILAGGREKMLTVIRLHFRCSPVHKYYFISDVILFKSMMSL